MTQDRRTVLEMLATGKITADEAERLLAALEAPAAEPAPKKAKYLHVVVDGDGRDKDSRRVNIRVPMQLLRAGVRLGSLMPSQAQERVKVALHRHGINLADIRPENLEDIVDQFGDISVDVADGSSNPKIRIFTE